jgi:hypothetical protein
LYTAIGWGTWAITDVIAPAVALMVDMDPSPAVESIATNSILPDMMEKAGGAFSRAAPYAGTAYDAVKLFTGACYGTGCPR